MTNQQIKNACEIIAENDRNSDIMDCLAEWQKGELAKYSLLEIINRELGQIISDIHGFECKDITLDESGRFEVDPLNYYFNR